MIRSAFLLFLFFAFPGATQPTASVAAVEKVECLPGSMGIKVALNIEVNNRSAEPLLLGRIEIAREKFYRLNVQGKPALIDLSTAPDEFVSDPTAPPEHIAEETLAAGSRKRLELDHIIYFMQKEVLKDAKGQRVLVSFDVTSVPNNGRVSEYWTAPIAIAIPKGCMLR
jgi:hypothetical protein